MVTPYHVKLEAEDEMEVAGSMHGRRRAGSGIARDLPLVFYFLTDAGSGVRSGFSRSVIS